LLQEDFMTPRLIHLRCALAVLGVLASGSAPAVEDHPGGRFEVTVINLTRGQQFTPILVATHKASVRLFEPGKPASAELATLAEEGNTAPLAAALTARPDTGQVVTGSGLTDPGGSKTVVVHGRGGLGFFSVAAMLIPTNDGFLAVNGVLLPRGNDTLTLTVPAYDSGSERNDETCASIPGPFFAECGGSGGGGAPLGGEEGYVHIHAGIHGIGDFKPSDRDWRNPVALIKVRRLP
jgi:hypothetical protein